MLLLFRLLAEKVSLLGLDYCYIVVQLVSSWDEFTPKGNSVSLAVVWMFQ